MINQAEAAKQQAILQAEGEAQARLKKAEAEAFAIQKIAEAEAAAVQTVSQTIGSSANPANYILAQKYIEMIHDKYFFDYKKMEYKYSKALVKEMMSGIITVRSQILLSEII